MFFPVFSRHRADQQNLGYGISCNYLFISIYLFFGKWVDDSGPHSIIVGGDNAPQRQVPPAGKTKEEEEEEGWLGGGLDMSEH